MTAQLFPVPVAKFFDNNGLPLAFGFVSTYAAGTSALQATYVDYTQTTQNTNPIQLNARGEASIWLDPTKAYKVNLTDALGNQIPGYPVDNIQGTLNPSSNIVPSIDNLYTLGSPTVSWANIYLGPNHAPAFDPVSGNIGYYARTAAEIAASATPTNFTSPTFYVSRMGAVGDGATDNTTAIQNILNAARQGRSRVHFDCQNRAGQTIYLTGPLTVYEGTYITADPGVVVQSTNTNANLQVFQCAAILGSATNLTANASLGATSVAVTSAAGLSAGQVIKISDSAFLVGSVPNFEHNEIDSISGTTIRLKQALIGNYTTANTAQLTPHSTPARDIHFENVKVLIPTTGGIDGGSFYFQDAYNCSVRNCESQGAKGQPSVQMWRSAYCRVLGGVLRDGQNLSVGGQGYGINIAQGSHHCVAFNVQMRNVRENAVSLGARFSGFVGCTSYAPYDNGFNAHASGSFDCFAIACNVVGTGGIAGVSSAATKGYYAGANDTRMSFIDCSVAHVSGRAIWIDNGSVDCEVKNFRAYNTNMQGSVASDNCVYLLSATRPRVHNVTVDANSQSAVRAAIRVDTCTDAIVRGGTVRNVPSGWGALHANCTGVQIDDLSIANVTQGVAFDTTPSSGTYIRRNKVDNDTAFAVNTGDVCEWNEYNTKRQNSRGKTSGSIADGGTINHGCVTTPYRAVAVSLGSNGTDIVKVSAISSTQITVTIKTPAGAAGSSCPIMWEADS